MAQNIFLKRDRLNGQLDVTDGRGYADDDAPTRLTRTVRVVMNKLAQNLSRADKFVEDNQGFDQISLTPDEQSFLFESMTPSDLQELAGIHGADAVEDAKNAYIQNQFTRGGGI